MEPLNEWQEVKGLESGKKLTLKHYNTMKLRPLVQK